MLKRTYVEKTDRNSSVVSENSKKAVVLRASHILAGNILISTLVWKHSKLYKLCLLDCVVALWSARICVAAVIAVDAR